MTERVICSISAPLLRLPDEPIIVGCYGRQRLEIPKRRFCTDEYRLCHGTGCRRPGRIRRIRIVHSADSHVRDLLFPVDPPAAEKNKGTPADDRQPENRRPDCHRRGPARPDHRCF
ncbi:hypothetical protein DESC_70048 [Desulfosarcina cetonica]|nr:hypothetical protein DESC_70048 [Desulfosarcina cetonica]